MLQKRLTITKWLSDLVFNLTYNPEGKEYVIPKTGSKNSVYNIPSQKTLMVAEEPVPYGKKRDDDGV